MSTSDQHNRIIKELCKEILLPLGVFQCGSSRVYVDDNGYFFTIIEFQPSSWSKGTYLNIAIHFLWNESKIFTYDFPFSGSRVKNYVEYLNDEQFEQVVREYAEFAREQVLFYRTLCDVKVARKHARKWIWKYRKHPYVHELKKLWKLDTDDMLRRIRNSREFWRTQPKMKKMTYHERYDPAEHG